MSPPPLFVGSRPLRVGPRIGKGGEGEVYSIDDAVGQAVKFYTVADVLDRQSKIAAMIRAGLARDSSLVAFPSEMVMDANGRFAGFLMKLVSGHQPIHHLYSPLDRKQHFPGADYRFLIHTAQNVARALADVHSRNCVIGDINHSSLLVSDRAIVALIDADSFQVSEGGTQYLCKVGVPEYTPPELQGQSLAGVTRTPNHDAFGIAVIIFQLLFMGRHPFVGSYQAAGEMPMEKAIAEYRFAYSLKRAVGMRPPPGTALLSDFPAPIVQAFETAFDQGTTRPSAAEWVSLLERFETQLRRCGDNELHYYSATATAPACPWCRMEKAINGLVLFLPGLPPQSASATAPLTGAFDLRTVWAAIEAVQLPPATPPDPLLPDLSVAPSDAAVTAAGKVTTRRGWAIAFVAGGIVGIATAPALTILWLGLGAVGLLMLFGTPKSADVYRKRLAQAETQWAQALTDWDRRCGAPEVFANKQSLTDAHRQLQALPNDLRAQLANYDAHRRDFQLKSLLENHRIGAAKIRGIGPNLTAALASWGIDSAFNVTYLGVLRIDGFGPSKAKALETWRRGIEARFVYDPRPNPTDARERDRINREAAQKGEQLRNRLSRGPQELRTGSQTVLMRWRTVDQPIVRMHAGLLQAQVDNDIVNPTIGGRLKRMSSLAWAILVLAVLAIVVGIANMPTRRLSAPVVQAPPQAQAAMEQYDPPRGFVVAPKGRIGAVNAREAPDGDAVVEHLQRGTSVAAIGRSTAPDGSGWIAFAGPDGRTLFVSEKVLKPAGAAAAAACDGKTGLAQALCGDTALRKLDDQIGVHTGGSGPAFPERSDRG